MPGAGLFFSSVLLCDVVSLRSSHDGNRFRDFGSRPADDYQLQAGTYRTAFTDYVALHASWIRGAHLHDAAGGGRCDDRDVVYHQYDVQRDSGVPDSLVKAWSWGDG